MSTVTYIIDDISVADAQLAAAQHNMGYRRTHAKTAQSKYMIIQSGDRMSFDCDGHVSTLSLVHSSLACSHGECHFHHQNA